jgi:hypothetical protein
MPVSSSVTSSLVGGSSKFSRGESTYLYVHLRHLHVDLQLQRAHSPSFSPLMINCDVFRMLFIFKILRGADLACYISTSVMTFLPI